MADLLRPSSMPAKLEEARRCYEEVCRIRATKPEVDWDALVKDLSAFGDRLRPRITDTTVVMQRQIAQGYSILFEGAQATLLDIDHGSYPFVTSSSATAGGALTGLGIPPTRVDGMMGIAKAYTTRVGAGPLPSEIGGTLEQEIREKGHEYGASTGRPRRCGWFDAVVVRYSVRVNGFDTLALTKLDVLDEQAEIKICTAYARDGETLTEFPADLSLLDGSQPVYETLPGWQTSTAGIRDFTMLPEAAQRYVARLEELCGCEIGIVSTGPERTATILRAKSAVASWFD
jgi:adenylosuccinate synthase